MKNKLKDVIFGGLADSLSLQSLSSPGITPDGSGFSETTGCATLMAHVICASAATPTHNVDGFALALAH